MYSHLVWQSYRFCPLMRGEISLFVSLALAKELLCLRCEIVAPINYFIVSDYFSIPPLQQQSSSSFSLILRPKMPHSKRVLVDRPAEILAALKLRGN